MFRTSKSSIHCCAAVWCLLEPIVANQRLTEMTEFLRLAVLWPVADQETATLMSNIFEELVAGRANSVALREAQLKMIKEHGAQKEAAHRISWAAFTLTSALPGYVATSSAKSNPQICPSNTLLFNQPNRAPALR
jgi:CHAT domain-containing protein